MNRTFGLLLWLSISSCGEGANSFTSISEVQLSFHSGWYVAKSLKFTGGRVFVRDHTTGSTSTGRLSDQQLLRLKALVSAIDFEALDSSYQLGVGNVSDCGAYCLYVKGGTVKRTIVAECVGPKEIEGLVDWLKEYGSSASNPIDSTISFNETARIFQE